MNIQAEVTEKKKMVHLIDWANPMENDFQIAEEVTIQGASDRRPDLVVYVNGIALAVIELKRSTVSAHEGIRQNIRNQQDGYIPRFFTTIQLLFAGNDTEGLHYGVIKTPENSGCVGKNRVASHASHRILQQRSIPMSWIVVCCSSLSL